jgi:hypothetical protein
MLKASRYRLVAKLDKILEARQAAREGRRFPKLTNDDDVLVHEACKTKKDW